MIEACCKDGTLDLHLLPTPLPKEKGDNQNKTGADTLLNEYLPPKFTPYLFRSRKGVIRSIGNGKRMVEFFSAATSVNVLEPEGVAAAALTDAVAEVDGDLADTGPEDLLYILLFGVILFANRRKLQTTRSS